MGVNSSLVKQIFDDTIGTSPDYDFLPLDDIEYMINNSTPCRNPL